MSAPRTLSRLCAGTTVLTTFVFAVAFPTAARAQETNAAAETKPAPAQELVNAAVAKAATGKKSVLIVFHASWCGWCHRLDDKVLNDPKIGALLRAQYEIIHLDVSENGPKKALENPGGSDLMAQWGGAKSGLPYYVFLDGAGKKQADSNVMPPQQGNIGYPGSPQEIAAFAALLKKTAPRLSESDRGLVSAHLKKNAP